MRLVSPSLLFKTAAIRFGMFHRGAQLVVLERRNNGGTARVEYAPGVYDRISLAGLCAGLRAALDLTIAGNASIHVTESGDNYALLNAEWEADRAACSSTVRCRGPAWRSGRARVTPTQAPRRPTKTTRVAQSAAAVVAGG